MKLLNLNMDLLNVFGIMRGQIHFILLKKEILLIVLELVVEVITVFMLIEKLIIVHLKMQLKNLHANNIKYIFKRDFSFER